MIIKPQYNGPQFWDGGKTLDLYFSRDKALDSRVTFTRASSATYYDASGVLQTASTDVARFDHNNFRTNLLSYSEDFSNAAWASSSANGIVTSNQVTAPDGTLTADKVAVASGQTTGDVRNSNTLSVGVTYALSVYAKAAEFTNVFLGGFPFGSGAPSVQINLLTGAVLENIGGLSVLVTDAGNNWWRIRISGGAYVAGPAFMYIGTAGTGNNTSGIYIWGAQLETGSTATSYIKTTSAAVTVGESLGLLVEGAGTNLLQRSEEFDNAYWTKGSCTISSNASTAPDGTVTADKMIANSGVQANIDVYVVPGLSNSTGYSLSVFAKAVEKNWLVVNLNDGLQSYRSYFNLATGATGTIASGINATIESVGNGWYRCSAYGVTSPANGANAAAAVQWTDADNSTTATGNGTSGIYIWGAQLETGTRASSYIKTVASTATRAADSASMTGTNFSQWFNAGEGTFFAEAIAYDTPYSYSVSDGTDDNRIASVFGASFHFLVVSGGTVQANFDLGTVTDGADTKIAGAYKANDFAASIDGGAVSTDASGSVPTVDRITIGAGSNGAVYGAITIKRLTYYPTRLTNGNLVELTNGTVRG